MGSDSVEKLNWVADAVGDFIQYWGFKKVHGKVWTHLFLSKEPLDAADLMQRLDISKSLASITINDLLKYQVILPKGKGPKDTQVYVANPDVKDVILNVLKEREQKMLQQTAAEYQRLLKLVESSSIQTVDRERMQGLGRMIQEAQMALTAILTLKEVNFADFQMK